MKIRKTLSVLAAAAVMLSPVSSVGAHAYEYYPNDAMQECTAEFAVLMWSENKDGTISITGCVPYISPYTKDYPTTNLVTVFVYNGILPIPTEINGKTVAAVNGVHMGKGLHLKYVKIGEDVTEISEKAFPDNVNIMITDEEYKVKLRR